MLLPAELFDSHDDRDDDGEGESVEEHKSVIMHLLSQVRLGMDLTKVRAPDVRRPDVRACLTPCRTVLSDCVFLFSDCCCPRFPLTNL